MSNSFLKWVLRLRYTSCTLPEADNLLIFGQNDLRLTTKW